MPQRDSCGTASAPGNSLTVDSATYRRRHTTLVDHEMEYSSDKISNQNVTSYLSRDYLLLIEALLPRLLLTPPPPAAASLLRRRHRLGLVLWSAPAPAPAPPLPAPAVPSDAGLRRVSFARPRETRSPTTSPAARTPLLTCSGCMGLASHSWWS